MKLAFASVLILVFSVTPALGQTASARINGRVSDGTGAVIPGVAVKVTNVDTNIAQTATSTETGDFTILYLPPGRLPITSDRRLSGGTISRAKSNRTMQVALRFEF